MKSNRSEKKRIVTSAASARLRIRIAVGAVILIAGTIAGVVWYTGSRRPAVVRGAVVPVADRPTFGGLAATANSRIVHEPVSAEAGRIVFEAQSFSDGVARFYSADLDGKTVKFFVLRSSDGVIRSAFDACDVCYPSRRGYRQEGDMMICNNCGQRFASVRINVDQGGCNPAPLVRTADGSAIIITLADLSHGRRFF